VWYALANRFASQSRAHITNVKQQFCKTCTKDPEYLQSAKNLSNQLAVIEKPIDDEDLISSIINGLKSNFIHFVTNFAFATCENSLSFDDFWDMLLNHEMLLNSHQATTPDVSTFALFVQKVGPKNFNPRSRGPH
jgi:hypothetical protein